MNTRTNKTVIAHPDETQIGQDRSVVLDKTKSINDIVSELNAIEPVGVVGFKDLADELQFMEETVAVRVHTVPDKDATPIVEVYNDGVPQRFPRGQWIAVKRKFVEVLARAKQTGIKTPETNDDDGYRTTRIDAHTGARYTFEMHDENPRGAAWLRAILAEA